mmetsp:Transcript_41493/g.132578  ORF Transcript_41493/g.132578 Transcript_41493/m.132578 type:complete len:250 (-) Transcript_41493:1415-2164(-)
MVDRHLHAPPKPAFLEDPLEDIPDPRVNIRDRWHGRVRSPRLSAKLTAEGAMERYRRHRKRPHLGEIIDLDIESHRRAAQQQDHPGEEDEGGGEGLDQGAAIALIRLLPRPVLALQCDVIPHHRRRACPPENESDQPYHLLRRVTTHLEPEDVEAAQEHRIVLAPRAHDHASQCVPLSPFDPLCQPKIQQHRPSGGSSGTAGRSAVLGAAHEEVSGVWIRIEDPGNEYLVGVCASDVLNEGAAVHTRLP